MPPTPEPQPTPSIEWRTCSEAPNRSATRREGSAERPEEAVAALARRQGGAIAARQLRELGVSRATIAEWARLGRLVRIHWGVYAYGHDALTPNGRWMAAVLACGPHAVLSHRSAAAAWALLPTGRSRIDVTAPTGRGRELTLIDAHRNRLHPSERTALDAIPITTPMRTLVDLAAVERPGRLAQAVENAGRLGLLDLTAIDDALARIARPRGARALEHALAVHRPEHSWTRSRLEREVLALLRRVGLPRPDVNAMVEGLEVDLSWPAERVVVELDTFGFHGTPEAFERDRARDGRLVGAGYRVVRITGERMRSEPEGVVRQLAELLRASGAPRAPARASPRRRTRGRRRPAAPTPAG